MSTVPNAVRLRSIDILRGLACVFMAIDHVRVYSGLPAGGPTPGIFFTRWITHFVAPAFCFLAGTGAFLHGRKLGDAGALRRFLVSRGLVLVALEMTVIRVEWTFNLGFDRYWLAGVIWMLGICMVLLAGLVRFSPRTVGIVGLAIIFGQQLVPLGYGALSEPMRQAIRPLFQVLYSAGPISLGDSGPTVAILYSIVPWIGVMAAGYGFGAILVSDAEIRRRWSLRIGLTATVLFLVIGTLRVLLEPPPAGREVPSALFRLLGQRKYPASELFLLMTLGPTIALVPWAERARGWAANVLALIGRVPMFYYLLHLLVIHTAAMVVSVIRQGHVDPWLFADHPMMPPRPPEGYVWSLGLLYFVWVLILPILYAGCRWYAGVKARHPNGWLRYI
jgi:uncharacterized membrane protein